MEWTNRKRFLKWACVLLLPAVLLPACSSASTPQPMPYPTPAAAPYSAMDNSAGGTADIYGYATSSETMRTEQKAEGAGETFDLGNTEAQSADSTERKIIKKAGITAETFDFGQSANTLLDVVLANDGYVERADVSTYYTDADYSLKRGYYTIRVPQENFDAARTALEKIGRVLSSGISGDDVTTQYYDIESRLSIKKEEEKRIFDLIARAQKVEELIQLEQRLSEIRTDIELYQTRLNTIDRLSSFSTISVSLTQVREYTVVKVVDDNFIERLKTSFQSSINFVIAFFQTIAIIFAASAVPLSILSVIGLIVFAAYKRLKRKRTGKENENDDAK